MSMSIKRGGAIAIPTIRTPTTGTVTEMLGAVSADCRGLLPSCHVDRDARHEVGVSGGEEADDAGLVFGCRDPAEGCALDRGGLPLRGASLPVRPDALRERETGRDGIHRDAMWPELGGELPGERDDAALGGCIGAAARLGEAAAGDRGDVDDLPALLPLHHRHHGMA